METFCEIILDLESELSKKEDVTGKVSEQMNFASSTGVHERIIQIGILIIHLLKGNYGFLKDIFSITG